MVAPFGGNAKVLETLVGLKIPSMEFTMSKYESPSGMGFVALQMILDFDRIQETPLLKPDVTRVGISNMPNRNCINLIQLLYVMIPMQPPTQESFEQWKQNQMKIAAQEQQMKQ